MKKELKDYLHFYLGCEVWDSYNEKKGVLFGIDLNTSGFDNVKVLHKVVWDLSFNHVKLILHSLSDMTEEEGIEAENEWNKGRILGESISHALTISDAFRIKYLLSKHFDLFGLIEEGLAINAATLKTVTE